MVATVVHRTLSLKIAIAGLKIAIAGLNIAICNSAKRLSVSAKRLSWLSCDSAEIMNHNENHCMWSNFVLIH